MSICIIVHCYLLAGIFSPTACALIAACKESRVRWPEASVFCYRASDFCSLLAQQASAVLGGNSNYRRIVINPANQKGFSG